MKVPVSRPFIGKEEEVLVNEALKDGHISGTSGRFIKEFEDGFAKYCGVKYGVAASSGTTALHLALATLGIGPDDEVLTSTFTNMATFKAALYQQAKPIPIDIEPDTWNLDPKLLESKITPKTKAIMVVHIYGHPVDMDPVLEIAKKHNLKVIEDAAEAHGAEYLSAEALAKGDKGRKAGSLGDIGVFSFYANKIITTGEGGMLVTNNKSYADRARSLRSLAYGDENRFMHKDIGFNYRMTNLQAAIGCAQLAKAEVVIKKKREMADFYNRAFEGIADLQLPVEKPYAKNVYWIYHVVLQGALKGKRASIISALAEKGVETREAFVPYNMQKLFIKKGMTEYDACPVANYVALNGFYLPSGADITKEELSYVADSLKAVIREV